MQKPVSGIAVLCALVCVASAAVAADRGVATRVAELAPRSTSSGTAIRPSSTASTKDLAAINRRLAAMQRAINQLKVEVNLLRQQQAQGGSGGGGQSAHSADEAYTMAAEARDIALRAEQKADQALSAAYSH